MTEFEDKKYFFSTSLRMHIDKILRVPINNNSSSSFIFMQ